MQTAISIVVMLIYHFPFLLKLNPVFQIQNKLKGHSALELLDKRAT